MTCKPVRSLFLTIALLLSQASIAASSNEPSAGGREEQICNSSTLHIIGKFLGIEDSRLASSNDAPGIVKAAACKKNPANPGITIAALAYENGKEDANTTLIALVDESERKQGPPDHRHPIVRRRDKGK